MDWRDKLPPIMTGGRMLDDAGEAWKAATGHVTTAGDWSPAGLTCDMLPAHHGPRVELACDVPWCLNAASVAWTRTAVELKSMRGPKIKGQSAQAQPERRLCAEHRPAWRSGLYLPIGQARASEARAAARPARKSAPAPDPAREMALVAALSELATTRAELDSARAQLVAHRETWALYRAALDDARALRAELALLTTPAGQDPAVLLAELVA